MAKNLAVSIYFAFGRRCSERAIVRRAGRLVFWMALRDVIVRYEGRRYRA